MIKITTKNGEILLSEKDVYSIEHKKAPNGKALKEVWVRILLSDGSWESDHIDNALSVEYIPDNEHIII